MSAMRFWGGLSLVTVALFPALGSAATATSPTCQPSGAHHRVLVTRPAVVILYDPTTYGYPDQLCDRVTGRRIELQQHVSWLTGHPDYVAPHSLVVSGTRVAYAFDDNEGTSGYSGIEVADAKTRAQQFPVFNGGGHYTRFRRLVLARSGGLAWSEQGKIAYVRICPAACIANDDRSAVRTIAQGRNLDPQSLHGVRGGISWREAGKWHYFRFA